MDNVQKNNLEEMAALLGGHQITDEQGAVNGEEPTLPVEPAATETKTPIEPATTVEKPAETEPEASPAKGEETENTLAEDETGKRYVPETRFKEVYGKAKTEERKRQEAEARAQKAEAELLLAKGQTTTPVTPTAPTIDRTVALEVEILKGKMPQFDPDSPDYSEELDSLGAEILAANPNLSRLEAAKKAMDYASKLASKVSQVKVEARTIKAVQSDQGITNRATRMPDAEPDINKMNDKELEAYMKKTGQW